MAYRRALICFYLSVDIYCVSLLANFNYELEIKTGSFITLQFDQFELKRTKIYISKRYV